MNKLLIIGASAALVLPLAVSAAGHRKPGLWETTTTMKFTKGGPQIPPEQLAKMQQMGIKMPMMGGEPHSYKYCLTPEEAAKDEFTDRSNGECQYSNVVWTSSKVSADMTCHTPRGGDMHGHFSGTPSGDTGFSGTSHMEGNSPSLGGDFAMDGQFDAKWLGADCGNTPATR